MDIALQNPTKEQWKNTVKKAVYQKMTEELEKEAKAKSTLAYLNPTMNVGRVHPATSNISSPREVTRSNIKLRILSGTYTLQTSLLKFKKAISDTCPLCKSAPEDIIHFLTSCPKLQQQRTKYLGAIEAIFPVDHLHIIANNELLCQLLIDPTHDKISSKMTLSANTRKELEIVTRNFLFAMHLKRSSLLAN